jgi:hypothetical protein
MRYRAAGPSARRLRWVPSGLRRTQDTHTGEPAHESGDRFGRRVFDRWNAEKSPAPRQRAAPYAIREQAEVAKAHEAPRDHVQQESSQEFVDLKRHALHAIVVRVVLPTKPDAVLLMIDEPIIRERDAVRVPTDVVEHLLGASEGLFGIDDPVHSSQLTEEAAKRVARGQIGRASDKGELPGTRAFSRPSDTST